MAKVGLITSKQIVVDLKTTRVIADFYTTTDSTHEGSTLPASKKKRLTDCEYGRELTYSVLGKVSYIPLHNVRLGRSKIKSKNGIYFSNYLWD